MSKRNKFFSKKNIIPTIIFVIGFGLCSYPLISSYIERQHQLGAVATYTKEIEKADGKKLEQALEDARNYNNELYNKSSISTDEIKNDIFSDEYYNSLLDVTGNSVMGSVEIPSISVNLPIYHGTSDEVLSTAVGHFKNSSLPVGGSNTRAVLTAHRGSPTSRLFTRLDEVEEGDLFYIRVLDETMAYKVCQIEVIEPNDLNKLSIRAGEDLVTLVTCTPYGINSHRLLVTGERVEYKEETYLSIEKELASPRELFFNAIPFIVIILVVIHIIIRLIKKGGKKNEVKKC